MTMMQIALYIVILLLLLIIIILMITIRTQGLIRTHKWPAPNVSGFMAQLVRALHWYREITGSNHVEVLTFSGFHTQLFKLRSLHCDDHSSLDFKSAVQYMKHFINYITSHDYHCSGENKFSLLTLNKTVCDKCKILQIKGNNFHKILPLYLYKKQKKIHSYTLTLALSSKGIQPLITKNLPNYAN